MEKIKGLASKIHVPDATALEALSNMLWIHSPFKGDIYKPTPVSCMKEFSIVSVASSPWRKTKALTSLRITR